VRLPVQTEVILAGKKLFGPRPLAHIKINVMAADRIPARKIQAIFGFLQQGAINYRKLAKGLSITRNTSKKYVASIHSFQVECPDKRADFDFYLTSLQQEHSGSDTVRFLQDQKET